MKIVYLNILGGQLTKKRFHSIINYFKEEKPKIICLAEAVKWDEEKITFFKKQLGFKNHYLSRSNTHHDLIIFTDEKVKAFFPRRGGFHHSRILLELDSFSLFFTHLNPFSEEERIKEIGYLLKEIKTTKKALLIGDLNSLSPNDPYDEKTLLKKLKSLKIKKFGTKKLSFDVQKKLLEQGLVDTVRKFSESFEHSVPTKLNKDIMHLDKLRLDYAYVTASLEKEVLSSSIVRNKQTEYLSDHFPLIIELKKSQ